ncbi:hypothetical protein J7L68_09235 [bacterium]|nr:hypothetical protein [bacterium]
MIYTIQILLFGILIILVINRIDRISISKFRRWHEEKIRKFLDSVDSYFIEQNSSELSGIAYRSRLLLELAENNAERIAGMRLILGSVSTIAQDDKEIAEIRKNYEIAVSALRTENYAELQFRTRWRNLCGKKVLPIDENVIFQSEKSLLLKQSNMLGNQNR